MHARLIITPYATLCYVTRHIYNWLVLADIRLYLSGALSRLIVRLAYYHLTYDSRFVLVCFVSGPQRATARVTSLITV
jgi:hypothetical protein